MLLSLSFARPSRDHPGGYQTLRAALGDIRLQMGTFSCPDGIWAVGLVLFFFFLPGEPSDTGEKPHHSTCARG